MDIAASPPSQARPAELDTLLSSPDQYTPEAIAPFEAYVAQQVQGKQYDAAANKALAKLYQFTPSRCQDAVLAQVLAKALCARPAGDGYNLLYIVPEALIERSPLCKRLAEADALLEASKFDEFWKSARAEPSFESTCPGFEGQMRRGLLDLLSETFQAVPLDLLSTVLGCDAAQAAALAKAGGGPLAPSSGASATFQPNAQNQQRKEVVEKTVALTSLLKLYDPEEQIFEAAPATAE